MNNLLATAVEQITKKDNLYELFAYQPGSREVIQELLNAGANPNAVSSGFPIICWFYNKIAGGASHLLSKAQQDELNQQYINIALDLKAAGGICDSTINSPLINQIEELWTAPDTVRATKKMFADPSLKRPLIDAIIDTQIADYLGVPMNSQRKEREKIAEEEKVRAAEGARIRAQAKSATKTASGVKSLDEPEVLQSAMISVDAYDYKATQKSIQEAEDAFNEIMKILNSNISDQQKVLKIRDLTEKVVNG